jgi:hypothetical protein
MDIERKQNKAKIIAACAVLAAVAILYIVTTVRAHNAAAPSATNTTTTSQTTDTAAASSGSAATNSTPGTASSTYKSGTYSASASYRTPESTESIKISLTVENDTVTSSSVQQVASDRESAEYQASFKQNYQSYVVGKKLSDIQLSHVSGSSLTSNGFNAALEQIKSQAQS